MIWRSLRRILGERRSLRIRFEIECSVYAVMWFYGWISSEEIPDPHHEHLLAASLIGDRS